MEAGDRLQAGERAMARGDWASARASFEAALHDDDSIEALDGLARALWWLGKIEAAHRLRRRAYQRFSAAGDLRRAAGIAMWLAREQVFLYGDEASSTAWFARARRLLETVGDCPEQGWYAALWASIHADAEQLGRSCADALEIARRYGDRDLEAFATCLAGVASTARGAVDDGLAAVDEAMLAATSGELSDPHVTSEIFCLVLAVCDRIQDLARAERWCRVASAYQERFGSAFLAGACRTTYGTVLEAQGRWDLAEEELRAALAGFEQTHEALRFHTLAKLAELFVRQGRLEEAERAIAGYEDHPLLLVPLARLRLARGETDVARACLQEALDRTGTGSVDAVPLLGLLAEVHVAEGALDRAAEVVSRLTEHATTSRFVAAEAAFASGRVRLGRGDEDGIADLTNALALLNGYERSWLAGRVRLALADAVRTKDRGAAVMHARAALATFERLGARPKADQAAGLLRGLGTVGHFGGKRQATLTAREQEVLALLALGLSNPEIGERLWISVRTAEHHVSNILAKLGLRNRSEAAAYAAIHRANP